MRFDDLELVRTAFGRFDRDLDRMDDAAEADVRPDDRRLRMALEQRLHLASGTRAPASCFGERHVDVVVQDHDEPGLAGEVEDAIERRVREAGGFAGDLRRDELLVDA